MLAEAATTELSKEKDPQYFEEHVQVAQQGGKLPKLPENNWKVIWDIRLFPRLMRKRG